MTSLWHCDAPGRECYEYHLLPHLTDAVEKGSEFGHRSIAPCHDDKERSLSTGIGGNGRPAFYCFACDDQVKTRFALIEAKVHSGCLIISRKDREEALDQVMAALKGDGTPTAKLIRIAAVLLSSGKLPHGLELEAMAATIGISSSSAYAVLRGEVQSADIVHTGRKKDSSTRQVSRVLSAVRHSGFCSRLQFPLQILECPTTALTCGCAVIAQAKRPASPRRDLRAVQRYPSSACPNALDPDIVAGGV